MEKIIKLYKKTILGKVKKALAISPDILLPLEYGVKNYRKGWKVTETGELYLGNFPIYENKTSMKTKEGNNIIIMLWDSLNFKTTKDNHINYYKVEVFIPKNYNNIFQILINQKPLNKDLDKDCFFCDLSKYEFQELPLLINTENIKRDDIINHVNNYINDNS